MATEPVTGDRTPADRPSGKAELRRLRAERDELEQRALAAEQRAAELAAEVAALRAQLAEPVDPNRLSLFDEVGEDAAGPGGDGRDHSVVPLVLGGVAVVSGMVAVLALVNRGPASPVTLLMLALTVLLGYLAWNNRVEHWNVSVGRGMVYIDSGTGSASYRFDLRSSSTEVEMTGQPGDPGWQVRFLRRHLDPFTVDASMVDPHEFVAQLREWRPQL